MPKMKTKKSAEEALPRPRQRQRSSARSAFKRHILTKKTTKNKRHLRGHRRSIHSARTRSFASKRDAARTRY